MPNEVIPALAAKMVVLQNNSSLPTASTVASGTLMVSGSKLYILGASDWELVTSA